MTILTSSIPFIWWGIGAFAVVLLLTLLLITLLFFRMKRFEKAYLSLKTFMSGNDLEKMLLEYSQRVNNQEIKLEQCNARLDPIEVKLKASVDRVQMIRYRAFEHVGSDLSFALALVNQEGDGIVLNSILLRIIDRSIALYSKVLHIPSILHDYE